MLELHRLIPYLSAFGISLFVALYALSNRRRPAARAFGVVALCQSLWLLGLLVELQAVSLADKILWDWLQIIPTAVYPFAFLHFCVAFAQVQLRRPAVFWSIISIAPVLIIAYIFTEPLHGQIYGDAQISAAGSVPELMYSFPPLLQMGWGLIIVMFSLGILFLIQHARGASWLVRSQTIIVLAGSLVPLVGLSLSFFDIRVGPLRDNSPIAFTLSNIVIGYGLFRQQLLDVVPIARGRMVEVMQDAAFVTDTEHRIIDMNAAARSLLPKEAADPVGRRIEDAFAFWPSFVNGAAALQEGGTESVIVRHEDGRSRDFSLSLLHQGTAVTGCVYLGHDITSRLQAEELLRTANARLSVQVASSETALGEARESIAVLQARLQQIVDRLPSCVVGVDRNRRVIHWNDRAQILTGITARDAAGQPVQAVWTQFPKDVQRLVRVLAEGVPLQETEQQSQFHYSVSVYPVKDGAVLVRDDITRQVNFQNAVIQAEKMVSVGGLAAGMAHEINNPLAGILQSLQVIEQRLLADTPRNIQAAGELGIDFNALRTFAQQRGISPLLAASRESCHRVTRIVANMLSFARRTDDELALADMTQLVEDTIDIARTDFRPEGGFDFRRILIERVFEADLPPVPCNRSRLQQVLLNLLKNGADAMNSSASQKEPTFTIRLSRRGGMVQLEVSDNGPGMEAEVRSRVFEPFFTTKEQGKGTGLGLSICYYIITENHKGTIDVESAPGKGTTFRIRLPLQSESP